MKTIEFLVIYAVLILLLSGCAAVSSGPTILDGQAQGIYHTTAQWIIDGALDGEPFSKVFVHYTKGVTVYARPLVDNIAFVCTYRTGGSCQTWKDLTGTLVNPKTWTEVEKILIDHGYKLITTSGLAAKSAAEVVGSIELMPVFVIAGEEGSLLDIPLQFIPGVGTQE